MIIGDFNAKAGSEITTQTLPESTDLKNQMHVEYVRLIDFCQENITEEKTLPIEVEDKTELTTSSLPKCCEMAYNSVWCQHLSYPVV